MTGRLVNAKELADYLGLSPATILDRFEAGTIPGFKVGQAVRFDPAEIRRWLDDECRRGPDVTREPAP